MIPRDASAVVPSAHGRGAPDPRVAVRRRDRGRDDAWIRAFLQEAPYGFLATTDAGGQPYLNANLFVYEAAGHCVYLHTHRTGRTRDNVAAEERVAFSAAAMGRLLPAAEALGFSVEYAGVVLFGTGHVVADEAEARHGLRLLLEKYAPHLRYGADYRGITAEELKRTAVYRVDIEAWSGKQKEAAADFPGAFSLHPVPVPFPGAATSPAPGDPDAGGARRIH